MGQNINEICADNIRGFIKNIKGKKNFVEAVALKSLYVGSFLNKADITRNYQTRHSSFPLVIVREPGYLSETLEACQNTLKTITIYYRKTFNTYS